MKSELQSWGVSIRNPEKNTNDHLQMERTRKIENVLIWIKNLKSEADVIKAEETTLAECRKVDERKAEALKTFYNYLDIGKRHIS